MKTYFCLLSLIAIAATGCATNHLQRFYIDLLHEEKVPKELRSVQPDIFPSENVTNDVVQAIKHGQTVVGYSDYWTSLPPTTADLKKQAQRVGANLVLFKVRHRGSETAFQPMYNWVPGTTATYNSSGSASAQSTASLYGNNYYGNAYGNAQGNYNSYATASTPGHLEYAGSMPVTIHYYDVAAVFLRNNSPGPNNAAKRQRTRADS